MLHFYFGQKNTFMFMYRLITKGVGHLGQRSEASFPRGTGGT